MEDLHLLLRLQETELKLEQLQKKIKGMPVFAEFKSLQSEAADAKEAVGWAENKLREHKKRVKRLEMELHQAEQEHKEVNDSLYGSSVQSAKELEQLGKKEVELLREKQRQEENLLLAMQLAEDLQNALDKSKGEYTSISKDVRALQKTGNDEINIIKEEIRFFREERELLLQQIDPALLAEYRVKRKEFLGRPLAKLEGDICSGCRVSVSSNTKSILFRPNVKVCCENCDRILIP
jgi:predicted  nucleic acid-binding Zn-ribbon protein